MVKQAPRLVDCQTAKEVAMLDHLQACPHCPKYGGNYSECTIHTDVSWVNRLGGCGFFPHRDMPPNYGRVGQQKQKHQDRSYTSKNEGKAKYRSY